MVKLSANQSLFFRTVLPALFLAAYAAAALAWPSGDPAAAEAGARFAKMGGVLAGILCIACILISGHFVDEVWDAGTSLVVKKGGKQIDIPLSQVTAIETSFIFRPAYAIIVLKEPSAFGQRINFHPRDSWGMSLVFEKNAIVVGLKEKIAPHAGAPVKQGA
jgi:hypothetical protein